MLAPLLDHLARERRGAGARPRRRRGVLLLGAAPVPDRRAARPRPASRARRSSSRPTTAPPASSPATSRAWLAPRRVRFYPSRGVTYESHLEPPPHLVGLRIAALDALGRRRRGAAGARGLRAGAVGEGPRPGAAAALDHARRRRSAGPRGVRADARRDGLRARRPGRGSWPVRRPRRAARRVRRNRRARRAGRAVRHRDRVAAGVLDLHAALAGNARAARARARGGARPRVPPGGRAREGRTTANAGHRRAPSGRSLRAAARADRRRRPSC